MSRGRQKRAHGGTDLHLFTDTLRNRHGSDTPRLGAPDDTIGAIPILVQELRKLSSLSRAGLTDDDDNCE